jgi:hypothetical protein
MVAYKPKRNRFASYKDADFSSESIRNFIDSILGGGGSFERAELNETFFSSNNSKDDL